MHGLTSRQLGVMDQEIARGTATSMRERAPCAAQKQSLTYEKAKDEAEENLTVINGHKPPKRTNQISKTTECQFKAQSPPAHLPTTQQGDADYYNPLQFDSTF